MPPRVRGARGGASGASAAGRTSSRIAEKATAAAEHAAQEREAAANASPDSSMPPPSSRGRGRGRASRAGGAEGHARRGTTRRGSRGGSSIASFTPATRDTPATSDVYAAQTNGEPFTPQRVDAASMVYGSNVDSWREAGELTPRTRDATANLMNKFIDRLYAVSKDLISHLFIEGEDRDESWVHELQVHKDIFNRFFKVYTIKTDLFIDIDAVSERTKSSGVPALWERMTKGVSVANLANLLSDIEDLNGDPSNVLNRLPLLQRIDDHFPATFTPGGLKGLEENRNWMVDGGTIQQSFAIRVQRFIETLRGVQQVNPFRLFAKIFLAMDVDGMIDDMVAKFSGDADYRPFSGFDINGPEMQKYREAIDGFRVMLTETNDTSAVISNLERKYAFDLFLIDLKEWARSFEIRVPGPARPGYNAESGYSADAQLHAEAAASQQGRFALSGVERLRQLTGGSAAQQSPRPQSEAPSFNDFGDDASLAGTDADMLARSRAAAAQAQYLMDDGNQGAVYAAAAADGAKQGGGRKRGRKGTGDGDSSAKRARATMPAPPPPAVPLGPLPPAAAAFDPVALSRQSQLISKANRKPAQPRQRKPWTAHDTQQLVRAVDVYKAKWSTIEKAIREGHIPFNVPERDQQGLRDKARLVKVDILRTDAVMPAGFDLVVLGRKEKDMATLAGRNPDRREDDVDADGKPTNMYIDGVMPPDAVRRWEQEKWDRELLARTQAREREHLQPRMSISSDEGPEAGELRPLQEAQMAVEEAPMGDGGAPDAPMAPADMGAPASEALGESESVVEVDSSLAPPIDPSISEAAINPVAEV